MTSFDETNLEVSGVCFFKTVNIRLVTESAFLFLACDVTS
jgi:hypothetical protein